MENARWRTLQSNAAWPLLPTHPPPDYSYTREGLWSSFMSIDDEEGNVDEDIEYPEHPTGADRVPWTFWASKDLHDEENIDSHHHHLLRQNSARGYSIPSYWHDTDVESKLPKQHSTQVEKNSETEGACQELKPFVGGPLDGYVIPFLGKGVKKSNIRISKTTNFRVWFNTYKRLWVLTVALNAVLLSLAATDRFAYGKMNAPSFALGNILIAVVFRNELFLRGLFVMANSGIGSLKRWIPVWIRAGVVLLLMSFGGIHSGGGLSALAWLIYSVYLAFSFQGVHTAIRVVSLIVASVTFVIILTAQAPVRYRFHEVFEYHHRWCGWFSIACLWAYVFLNAFLGNAGDISSGQALVRDAKFWFSIVITACLIIPWTTVRRIPVKVIPGPNGKAAILKFEGGIKNGLLGRVARDHALSQWHAFGIIGEGPNADCHYMAVGVQGNWTSALVRDRPTHLWTRTMRFAGISYLGHMFTRGVAICTGSGIGASLSVPLQDPRYFLIWIASDMEATFGEPLFELIDKNIAPERRIIIDTKKTGRRPDTAQLLKDVYKRIGAE
ncbi:hypothetical protein HDU93_001069, partial [Gonapodya sp. JEL0774]